MQAQTFLKDREINNYFFFLDSDSESQNFEKS